MLVKSPSEMQHEMHAGSLIARCQSQVNNKTKTSPKKININNICKKKKSQEATICQRPGGADISFAACLPPPPPPPPVSRLPLYVHLYAKRKIS